MDLNNLLPDFAAIDWHILLPLMIALLFFFVVFQRFQQHLNVLSRELDAGVCAREEMMKEIETIRKKQQEMEKKLDRLWEEERKKVARMAAELFANVKVPKTATERDTFAEVKVAKTVPVRDIFAEVKVAKTVPVWDIFAEVKVPKTVPEKEERNVAKKKTMKFEGSSGQIVFRMANFKAFSEGHGPKDVYSEPVVHINGLPWQIGIEYDGDSIRLSLNCAGDNEDWIEMARNRNAAESNACCHCHFHPKLPAIFSHMAFCKASCQFSVVSRTKSDEFHKGNLDILDFFYPGNISSGRTESVKIEELIDPKNGFYEEKDDTMTFKAKVVVERRTG